MGDQNMLLGSAANFLDQSRFDAPNMASPFKKLPEELVDFAGFGLD